VVVRAPCEVDDHVVHTLLESVPSPEADATMHNARPR
jgi:hypothetical protein